MWLLSAAVGGLGAVAVVYAEFAERPPGTLVPSPNCPNAKREVLDLLARGLPNAAIAHQLFLSPKTIRNQVSNVLTKLQVSDRAQAVARARDAGLGNPSR